MLTKTGEAASSEVLKNKKIEVLAARDPMLALRKTDFIHKHSYVFRMSPVGTFSSINRAYVK